MSKKSFLILICTVLIMYLSVHKNYAPVEEINIASGLGVDIENLSSNNFEYIVPFQVYSFSQTKPPKAININGTGKILAETRDNRQLKSKNISVFGAERIFIFSENLARQGIGSAIDIIFNNSKVNDRRSLLVCKDTVLDIFKTEVKGYNTSSEYVEGLIKNAKEYSFFSDNYTNLDLYIQGITEGEHIVLPYVEKIGERIQLTGLSLFKEDKMKFKIDINDSKWMNILRENNVKGIISLEDNSEEFINYYAISKKKVKCKKENEKYKFIINLSVNGDITVNTKYSDINYKNKEMIQKDLEKYIKSNCDAFLDKMQNVYKIDALNLGEEAAARYGRDTGVDWDKIVSESDIEVNVKVKIDKLGRGEY